jgi:hypothetical protein
MMMKKKIILMNYNNISLPSINSNQAAAALDSQKDSSYKSIQINPLGMPQQATSTNMSRGGAAGGLKRVQVPFKNKIIQIHQKQKSLYDIQQ